MVGKFLVTAGRSVKRVMQSHCQAASEFAERLDLGEEVRGPLLQAFERWDGKGIPGSVAASDLALAARLVHLADNIEAFHHAGGADAALEVARQRRGTQFDPALVDCFCQHENLVLAGLDQINAWDQVISLDPRLEAPLNDDQLDRALEAFGDFADLKSPFRLGHSRGVASVAAGAAERLGLAEDEALMLYRAALVHDVGMVGVPSGVWDEPKPWSLSQQERARTHPYLTERMFTGTPTLAAIARCASLHHERLDGSGYPRGLRGDAIPFTARILAASDVYHALQEPRPHREARPADAAALILREEARAGRIDGEVVNAVLAAAGQRVRRRAELPAGLTPREAQVLFLLARGLSNPQIAAALTVSRKTVSSHLEHIYAKLGVSTRTNAALLAMRHGLIDDVTSGA
jgi:HD-GYP domain-containing protein (c-di-GMP phosphodiesterase class II)